MHFNFLDTALCLRVVETLLHFLWQGFAIGLAMWVINGFVSQTRSNLRYRINLFALLLMAACLPLTFALLPEHQSLSASTAETVPALASNTDLSTDREVVPGESFEPSLDPAPVVAPQQEIVEASNNQTEPLPVTPSPATDIEQTKVAGTTTPSWMNRIAPYATVVYAIGVMLMLIRLLLAVWGGQRLRRSSQVIDEPGLLTNVRLLAHRLGLKVAPVVATCSRITVPVVVGILKPMILLPPSLVTGMSPAQLEAVLSHELAHLRRFDLLINLLQRLIEAMLFFHPAVWYVSRRVSLERENSCDDLVMEHGCDRLTYADALLRMAEICNDSSRQPGLESAAVLAATGNQPSEFKSRVLRVVGETSGPPLRLTRGGFTVLTLLLISSITLPWVMISRAAEEKTLDGQSLESQHPVLELSGPITDEKFVDAVAKQVARLPFATQWQLENAKRFARQITRENLSPDMPKEARRHKLDFLNKYVSHFIESHQGETEDSAYCRRPEDVRNLLWRLKLALRRKPLDEQARGKLDSQMAELDTWVRSVPMHPRSKLTHEAVVSKLKKRQADPMEPLFKHPLPEEAFDEMMSKLNQKNSSSIFAESHAVAEWFYARTKATPSLLRLTDDPAEKTISHGTSNGHVSVGFQDTEVWLGNRNGMDAWSKFIDFSESVPGIRSLDPPRAVIEAGDDALRKWVESSEYDDLGHITFDFEQRRLVGVRGTRLLGLNVDSYVAVDRLNGAWLKQQIRQQGLEAFSLAEPKSVDELGHDLTYDQFVGALTADDRLYVMKVETIGTLSRMIWYRVRLHNPPHPDEATDAPNPDEQSLNDASFPPFPSVDGTKSGPPTATVRQPVLMSFPTPNAGVQAPPGNPSPQPVDATTLELYNQYIAKVGKIESASIAAAIELVTSRAAGDPAFRALLRKDFATSHQEENQRYDSRKQLALITKVLYRDGGMRWQIEEEKRTGNPGQRALPQRDFLYQESPLLADVIKYGRKCGRSEIDDFAFAVRQAHHPQSKQFLLDVLQNPSDADDPINGTDITKGNWPDNVGGGWEEARFLAAVGLAELGVEEGVRWLIERARPNDFGEGGTIWHHTHFRSRTDGMRSNCDLVLHDLAGVQKRGDDRPTDWDKWWNENKASFTPRPVTLKESVGY